MDFITSAFRLANCPWGGGPVGLENRLDRRVVAEPRLAPLVQVIAIDRPQAPRGEDVGEPVSRLSPRPGVEPPADVAAGAAAGVAGSAHGGPPPAPDPGR